jgi:leader peptidase (prepilin peptidase)/N-methyltransferase
VETYFTVWLGVLGLCVGSFLNVVIARVPNDESVVKPRSKCPKCGHQLPWYENIPVLSWLWLRGKCSGCKAPISPRYIMVELLTGILFLAAVQRTGWDWSLVRLLTFITLLIPLVFIDAEHWVLPFSLTLPGIAAGLLLAVPSGWHELKSALWGAGLGFLIYRSMELLGWVATSWKNPKTGRREGKEAMGAGDKYLVAMICASLGVRALLAVIFLSSLQSAVYAIIAMRLTGRAGPAPAPDAKLEAEADDDESDGRRPWTPLVFDRARPLWWRLLVGLPDTIFTQDIPDPMPIDPSTGEEEEWVPQANNLPLGPWLGLAGLQWLFIGTWLANLLSDTPFALTAEVMFGS